MDFQLQVQSLGYDGERAQLTLRDETGMIHLDAKITAWGQDGAVRVVSGKLPQVNNMIVLKSDEDPVLFHVIKTLIEHWPTAEVIEPELQPLPLPVSEARLSEEELSKIGPGTSLCRCEHWDNVHGPFCFACDCLDFVRK